MEIFITYAGFVVGILSLVAAYVFYRRSLRIKEPVYSIRSNNLISGSQSTLPNLYIAYKNYQVENLTVSKVLLYNRGAETITRQDIETKSHLSISSERCNILDGSILQFNNPSNNLSVSYDHPSQVIQINFDYLDQNQGVVIQVIHTGLSSDYLHIYGDIMGVQKLIQVSANRFTTLSYGSAPEGIKARLMWSSLIVFLLWLIAFSWSLLIETDFVFLLLMIVVIFTFFALTMWFWLIFPNVFGINRVPKGLEKFLE